VNGLVRCETGRTSGRWSGRETNKPTVLWSDAKHHKVFALVGDGERFLIPVHAKETGCKIERACKRVSESVIECVIGPERKIATFLRRRSIALSLSLSHVHTQAITWLSSRSARAMHTW
jgi:hypothetical protein